MSLKGFVGVIIGFSGVVFIFKDGLGSFLDADYRIGMMFMGFAITAWAAGTIYTKIHGNKSKNIVLNLFYQFTMASCIQIVLAFIFSPNIDVNLWSSKSIFAALYLSIFGSVIAFFSYNYALKHVTPVQVSILAYINTIIAVFFGWLILDEKITIDFIIVLEWNLYKSVLCFHCDNVLNYLNSTFVYYYHFLLNITRLNLSRHVAL